MRFTDVVHWRRPGKPLPDAAIKASLNRAAEAFPGRKFRISSIVRVGDVVTIKYRPRGPQVTFEQLKNRLSIFLPVAVPSASKAELTNA